MTTETKPPVTTHELALYTARVIAEDTDEKAIARLIDSMSKDDYMRMWVRGKPITRVIAAIAKAAKARAQRELAVGEIWKDPDTEVVYVWGSGQSDDWKLEDIDGFVHGLRAFVRADGSRRITDDEIDMAMPPTRKPDHKRISDLAKSKGDDVAQFIDDKRKKPETKPDLREGGA